MFGMSLRAQNATVSSYKNKWLNKYNASSSIEERYKFTGIDAAVGAYKNKSLNMCENP